MSSIRSCELIFYCLWEIRGEVAEIVGRDTKLDLPTLETIVNRRRFGIRPITDKVIAGQQEISDLFYKQKFITKKINVKDVTLTPEEYAAILPAEIKPWAFAVNIKPEKIDNTLC